MVQGRPLTIGEMEMVIKVYKQMRAQKVAEPRKQVHLLTGVSEKKIKEIWAQYRKKLPLAPKKKKPWNKGKKGMRTALPQSILHCLARKVIQMNKDGEPVTSKKLKNWLNTEHEQVVSLPNLKYALKTLGFQWRRAKRSYLISKESIVVRQWRRRFIHQYWFNKESPMRKPFIWLDETYIHQYHTAKKTWTTKDGHTGTPPNNGNKWIVIGACTEQGWISSSFKIYREKGHEDYHGTVTAEKFEKWFKEYLLPSLTMPSIIVLDNARYHKRKEGLPKGGISKARKNELIQYLRSFGMDVDHSWLVVELKEEARRVQSQQPTVIQQLAAERGHSILYAPPYHPEINPIEYGWGIAKNHTASVTNARITMEDAYLNFNHGLNKATDSVWKDIIHTCEDHMRDIEVEDDADDAVVENDYHFEDEYCSDEE
jgi:transposase